MNPGTFRHRRREVSRRYRGPWLPSGIKSSDVLFLYDPSASPNRDWGGDQTLAEVGTVPAVTTRAGARCLLLDGSNYLRGAAWDTALEFPVTFYDVCEHVSNATFGAALLQIYDGSGISSNGVGTALRQGVGYGGTIYAAAAGTQDYTAGGVSTGLVQIATLELKADAIEAFIDGSSNGGTAHAREPASLDFVSLGGLSAVSGSAYRYYTLAVRGERDAAVESGLRARFPIGVSP